MGFKFPWEGDGVTGQLSRIDAATKGAEDALLKAIEESKQLSTTGPNRTDLNRVLNPLIAQRDMLDSEAGRYGGLSQLLQGLATNSALGDTSNAQIAAVNAARLSGSGRFGAGGFAASQARRGAVDAAAMQSSALANLLLQSTLQGTQVDAAYRGSVLQQRGQLQQQIAGTEQSFMGLQEERARMPISYRAELANILLGTAGIQQGIATQKLANASSERTMFVNNLFKSGGGGGESGGGIGALFGF
jgi:hypothetical protein